MKKISQKDIQKTKKNSKKMKERSRFVFDKKKAKIIKNIKKIKKVEKIVSLSTRKKALNKSRIIDIWKNEMNEKKFLIKLKNTQIFFLWSKLSSLSCLLKRSSSKFFLMKMSSSFMSIRSDLDRLRKKEKNNDMFVNFLKQRLSLKTSSKSLN